MIRYSNKSYFRSSNIPPISLYLAYFKYLCTSILKIAFTPTVLNTFRDIIFPTKGGGKKKKRRRKKTDKIVAM